MNYTDMIPGKLYYTSIYGSFLIEFDRIEGTAVYVNCYATTKFSNRVCHWGDIKHFIDLREATPEEKDWFYACKAAGTTVAKLKKILYEIY